MNKAKAALDERFALISNPAGTENPYKIKDELQASMPKYVGIFRTEKELQDGLSTIKQLRERFDKVRPPVNTRVFNMDKVWTMEIFGNLEVSHVVCAGAIRRTESRGAHSRRDFKTRDDENWLNHTLAKYTSSGPEFSASEVDLSKYPPEERKY